MTLLGMFTHPPYVYLESQQKTTCLPHPGLHKCSPALWNMLDVQLINTASVFTAKKTQSNQLSKNWNKQQCGYAQSTQCAQQRVENIACTSMLLRYFSLSTLTICPLVTATKHTIPYESKWEFQTPMCTNFMSRKRLKTTQSSQVPQPPKLTLA